MTEHTFDAVNLFRRFMAGESIADLATAAAIAPLSVESVIRLAAIQGERYEGTDSDMDEDEYTPVEEDDA